MTSEALATVNMVFNVIVVATMNVKKKSFVHFQCLLPSHLCIRSWVPACCSMFALSGFKHFPDSQALFNHRANGDCIQVNTGSRRFLRNPSCTFALVSDPGWAGIVSPYRQPNADPIFWKMKPPTITLYRDSIARLQHLLCMLHNQRYHWLCNTRFRLMVSLCRAEVEPAGFQ